jgi:hypothetical protein
MNVLRGGPDALQLARASDDAAVSLGATSLARPNFICHGSWHSFREEFQGEPTWEWTRCLDGGGWGWGYLKPRLELKAKEVVVFHCAQSEAMVAEESVEMVGVVAQ